MENINQYLTFTLDGDVYAIDVSKVYEVVEFTSITRVPNTPQYMRGVINLRGSVVPVIDVRLKFGLSITEKTVDTCIIVLEVSIEDDKVILGALADSVQEVIELDAKNIEPPPRIGTKFKTDYLKGIGRRDDEFIILLDIDRIMSREEMSEIKETESRVDSPVEAK